MRDRTFTGKDVAEAVASAEKVLGMPPGQLRYVVLKPGTPGGLGISATPAEIAVLMDEGSQAGSPSAAASSAAPAAARDPRDLVVKVLETLVDVAGLTIGVQVEEDEETLRVNLSGEDHAFFLDHDAEVLDALQYLLRRALPEGFPRLVLECEGHRDEREEGIRRKAREIMALVLQDGAARTTQPLNSYERRIVHMTVAETPGLRTHSVGEGADRRVTIAPVLPDDIE
jgi:spoIIIJ-associated protein